MTDVPTIDDPFTVPTRHWHRIDDGRVQCDVCPRACRLHEGQRTCSRRTAGPAPHAPDCRHFNDQIIAKSAYRRR
jgi:hypothetical protein